MSEQKDRPTDERLDDLEEKIAKVRESEDTEEAVHGSFYESQEQEFVESGDERGEAADDQAAAPG